MVFAHSSLHRGMSTYGLSFQCMVLSAEKVTILSLCGKVSRDSWILYCLAVPTISVCQSSLDLQGLVTLGQHSAWRLEGL